MADFRTVNIGLRNKLYNYDDAVLSKTSKV